MRVSYEGRLLRLTLDRPEKRNALDSVLCGALVDAMKQGNRDPGVGAILLEGSGPMFCAGMDLDESLAPGAADRTAIHGEMFSAGFWLHKPLVASIQGGAIAGGLGLVANAHFAVAAEDARFSLPEINIGMWPFVIWKSLTDAMGERRALDLSLTGRTFSAHEALAWGLVHQLAPPAQLPAAASEIAAALAGRSPEVIRRGFALLQQSRMMNWTESIALALRLRSDLFENPDFKEGVRAFREKRPPRWPSLDGGTANP